MVLYEKKTKMMLVSKEEPYENLKNDINGKTFIITWEVSLAGKGMQYRN